MNVTLCDAALRPSSCKTENKYKNARYSCDALQAGKGLKSIKF
jgi:hypothetical protein